MTIKELIEELKKYPEDMTIMFLDSEWAEMEIEEIVTQQTWSREKNYYNIVLIK